MADIVIRPTNVFPTTKMNSVNKLITEGNITRLLNNLLDTDSYLIPTADSNFGSEVAWGGNLQGLIKVEDVNFDLECVLKGYYFNLGPLSGESGILTQFGTQAGTSSSALLLAQIIIDNTNPDYPELYGEEADTSSVSISISPAWNPSADPDGAPVVPEMYRNLDIKGITAEDSGGTMRGFTLNSDWKLVPTWTEAPSGVTISSYAIEYVSYYSLIKLHVLTGSDAKIPADVVDTGVESLGNNAISVSLPILCKYNNNYYFPMTSYPKFTSISIQSIDGGIIA